MPTKKSTAKKTKPAKKNIPGSTVDSRESGKGIELLLDKMIQSYVRLPMLDMVADKFVSYAINSLRSYTSESVNVEIESIRPIKFGEYIDVLANPSMIGIFKAIEWGSSALMIMSNPLVYGMVDTLLGGKKIDTILKVEGRAFTSIEYSIARNIMNVLLDNLIVGFESVTTIDFQMERIESNPRFASIARLEDIAILISLAVSIENKEGTIDIIFPYATIEPVKKLLAQAYVGERVKNDPTWFKHLEQEISNATTLIEAVFKGTSTTTAEICNLKIGDTITLDNKINDEVELGIAGAKIGTGELGKTGDNIAVKLTDDLNVRRNRE